ncbi:hypothetical protein CANINC_000389 [Pichia inconspicua]|uniref:Uncharacterized protein n=1 Tax=Pichia inconspicua TaxID=52247 RepID=A0A4T0X6B7_9ASCO|nr:hypothetical protein CANINC_000389 [[Candida] inconspicua]
MTDLCSEENLQGTEVIHASISEEDASDDDFGDFEEVDQEEVPKISPLMGKENTALVHYYNGDYENEKEAIDGLVSQIFGSHERESASQEYQFELDDRSEKIYERLIAEDHSNTGFIWKKSVIYKQMLLNLDIEETETLTQQHRVTSAHSNVTQFQNLYDLEQTADSENDMTRIMQQVPDFKTMGTALGGDEFNNMLDSTSETLQNAKEMLVSDDIEVLANMKNKLLLLTSVWDEHMKSIKADNELFTSYVDNLIGNTQKMRREKRILQTKTKGKSRRFRK